MHAWGVRSVTPVMRDRVSVAGANVTVITIAGPVPEACRARYPLRLTFACRPAKATGSPTTSAGKVRTVDGWVRPVVKIKVVKIRPGTREIGDFQTPTICAGS